MSIVSAIAGHWRRAFRETAEASLAAGIAWWIGLLIFGEHKPIFAAIAAVVCLAPGLPSHSVQALGMIVGVMAGIGVAELAIAYGDVGDPILLGASVFIAMMISVAIVVKPIIGIQSGASAVIVIAEGSGAEPVARFGDAAIGGGVALLFSQVIFTPDPFRIMSRAGKEMASDAREVRQRLGDKGEDRGALEEAMADLRDAEQSLGDSLDYAMQIARRTFRGRMRREEIESAVSEWRRLARRLHLALGSAGHELLEDEPDSGRAQDELAEADRLIAEALERVGKA